MTAGLAVTSRYEVVTLQLANEPHPPSQSKEKQSDSAWYLSKEKPCLWRSRKTN
jgi:hypothetical protein